MKIFTTTTGKWFVSFVFVAFLWGCNSKGDLAIHSDHSALLSFTVTLEGFYQEALEDLSELNDELKNLLDPAVMQERLRALYPDANIEITSPQRGKYRANLSFAHLQSATQTASDNAPERFFDFFSKGNINTLTFRMGSAFLGDLFPVESLVPESQEQSEEAYLDSLTFTLGGQGNRERIRTSRVTLLVSVEGTVVAQQGGNQINDSQVVFSSPLLATLTGEQEVYSLSYRLADS